MLFQGPVKIEAPFSLESHTDKMMEIHHLKIGGLSHQSDSGIFYIRQEWISFWKLLNSQWVTSVGSPTTKIFLTGPLGTGKSSLAWVWCCYLAANEKKKQIRWFSILPFAVQEVKMEGSHIYYRTLPDTNSVDWYDVCNSNVELIVFDGYKTEVKVSLVNSKIPVLFIQSMQIRLNTDATQFLNPLYIYSFGWQLEECLAASEDPRFFNQIQKYLDAPLVEQIPTFTRDFKLNQNQITQIASKFHFAGHSARWMFSRYCVEVTNEILDTVRGVCISDFCKGLVGINRIDAVNNLYSAVPLATTETPNFEFNRYTESGNIVVSKYVLLSLKSKIDQSFIDQATSHAKTLGMNAFDEWIFQLRKSLK